MPVIPDSLKDTDSKSKIRNEPASFKEIDDELRDAKRVHSQGQEEDLRYALNLLITRVTNLAGLLKDAYKANADIETSLNLADSNLKLLMSNNEMLEEALKRDPSQSSRDVGWRRWSAKEGEHLQRASDDLPRQLEHDRPRSSIEVVPPEKKSPIIPHLTRIASSPNTNALQPAASMPVPGQDSRFFRFRFGPSSNAQSRTPAASRPGTPSNIPMSPPPGEASTMTSNSPVTPGQIPAAVSKDLEQLAKLKLEFEDIEKELLKEREAKKKACEEKSALEGELESLSQALFEEANKMVATERIQRAQAEEDLKEARLEKEALRSALKLIEGENTHLRSQSGSAFASSMVASSMVQSSSDRFTESNIRLPRSRSSSRDAIKSRRSSVSDLSAHHSAFEEPELLVDPKPPRSPSPDHTAVPNTPMESADNRAKSLDAIARRGSPKLSLSSPPTPEPPADCFNGETTPSGRPESAFAEPQLLYPLSKPAGEGEEGTSTPESFAQTFIPPLEESPWRD